MSSTEDPVIGQPDGANLGGPTVPPSSNENPTLNSNFNVNRPTGGPSIRFGFGVTATVRATQHQLPTTGLGRIGGGGGAAPGVPQPTNNNNGELPQQTQNLFQMRDRLFLALFFRVSLIYARAFPKTLRRALEFCLLMQSILLLFILGYIHVVYTRTPITCLGEFKDSWPKNGILRVEITTDPGDDYDLTKSYAKEDRLRQRAAASQFGHYTDDILSIMLTADTLLLDRFVSTAGDLLATVTGDTSKSSTTEPVTVQATGDDKTVIPTSSIETEPPDASSVTTSTIISSMLSSGEGQNTREEITVTSSTSSVEGSEENQESKSEDEAKKGKGEGGTHTNKNEVEEDSLAAAEGEERSASEVEAIAPSVPITASGEGSVGSSSGVVVTDSLENIDVTNPDSPYFNKTLEEIEIIKMQQKKIEEDKVLNSSITDFEMFANSVWLQEQAYIVEYALEYGFLRLSSETRQKLGIPVKLVTLNPSKENCFGDTFSLFLLENFLGYDDILMSSIKNLAESEENKGYLRNVVTGEQFRFVPMWMARSSYIPALLIMLVFTVSISMLLRYSHHQIFVFIVDLLNNIEGAGSIHVPAAPLFTVILALVGMEAIMSEFFNDTSTAFYVILIVWIADQYDSIALHHHRTYWQRFFYLYHFAFYAYHYRFNGQYGGLALLVSWSFIQHSMVYFYHHYELPAILRQAHQPSEGPIFNNEGTPPPQVPPTVGEEAQNIPTNITNASAVSEPSQHSPEQSTSSTTTSPLSESITREASESSDDFSNRQNGELNMPNASRSNSNTLRSSNPSSPSINNAPVSQLSDGVDNNASSDLPDTRHQTRSTILRRIDGGPSLFPSAPTIFNDRNINIVYNNLDGREEGVLRDNGMTSGVNNNDCNPTRVLGMGQSESEDILLSRGIAGISSGGDGVSSPAQVATTDDAGCSRESHLNLRPDTSSTLSVVEVNPKANNHRSSFSNEERREDDGDASENSSVESSSSILRHRLARGDGEQITSFQSSS